MSEQAAPLFDRTVPEPFLELLAPGGELSFVVERSIKEADLDLQLRARPTKLIAPTTIITTRKPLRPSDRCGCSTASKWMAESVMAKG